MAIAALVVANARDEAVRPLRRQLTLAEVNWEEPSDAMQLMRRRITTLRKYSIRSVY